MEIARGVHSCWDIKKGAIKSVKEEEKLTRSGFQLTTVSTAVQGF